MFGELVNQVDQNSELISIVSATIKGSHLWHHNLYVDLDLNITSSLSNRSAVCRCNIVARFMPTRKCTTALLYYLDHSYIISLGDLRSWRLHPWLFLTFLWSTKLHGQSSCMSTLKYNCENVHCWEPCFNFSSPIAMLIALMRCLWRSTWNLNQRNMHA